jgi:hypothetical protein
VRPGSWESSPRGPAAEREAAVAAARALRDSARVVHANAETGLRETARGRAAGDSGADDRDVDGAVERRLGQHDALLFQPVRDVHARPRLPQAPIDPLL